MLRRSKDPYTDFSRGPSHFEKIVNRLAARAEKAKEEAIIDAEEEDEPAITAEVEITLEDVLEAHDMWQEEAPNDPEAIHRLVDKLWGKKRDADKE